MMHSLSSSGGSQRALCRLARRLLAALLVNVFLAGPATCLEAAQEEAASEARRPADERALVAWLKNMIWHHQFSIDEVRQATGLAPEQIEEALRKYNILPGNRPARAADAPLLVLPYPGGRHPRIGFLEGAVNPQRETKISVFAPWQNGGYAVADIPEAIWSNLGLTYLAHTHVPTIWTEQGINLERLEWNVRDNGTLDFERTLPNKIRFGTRVAPRRGALLMEMWLTNGTEQTLSDLRVQNCVMLKGLAGFEEQTRDNKVYAKPYAAAKSKEANRWVITAWEPCFRPWGNERCPCVHSDPKFPECPPGKTESLRGWLSFYEGTDIEAEFRRIDKLEWRTEKLVE
jgi:hypothetical protein